MDKADKKLRIAVFHCGFVYSGGGERIVLEEVLGLRRLGYEVACYAPTLDRDACYPDLIDSVAVRTLLPQLPKGFPLRDAIAMGLSSLLAPLYAFRFRKFDAFVGANQPGAWIAFCVSRVLRKPYVVYLNQPNRLIYPRAIDRETGWLTKPDYRVLDTIIQRLRGFVAWADRVSFTRAAAMLANGDYIAGVIEKVYGRKQTLCPAGCHPQPGHLLRLNPRAAFEGEVRIKGNTIHKPYLLITNRHEPQKKFEHVIEAMARLKEAFPHVSLVIPGPFTAHTPRLIDLARRLKVDDRVLLPGQVTESDLQRLYREATVYCYPAPEEDFGMGVIEAMAWGLPVVAWNHAGPTVTVAQGETGFLARPYSVEDYARAIRRLLEDPALRARMGRAAHARAEALFTWQRHVAILERQILIAAGQTAPATEAESAISEARVAVPVRVAEEALAEGD
jgi:glycosyltransferase involved in cell wall biosynthesis